MTFRISRNAGASPRPGGCLLTSIMWIWRVTVGRKLYRPFDKPQDEEQDHRADDSDDDRPDHSPTNRYPQCTGKVATDDGTHDPNNDIDDEAKSAAFDDLTRHEASDRADHKPYDYLITHEFQPILAADMAWRGAHAFPTKDAATWPRDRIAG